MSGSSGRTPRAADPAGAGGSWARVSTRVARRSALRPTTPASGAANGAAHRLRLHALVIAAALRRITNGLERTSAEHLRR